MTEQALSKVGGFLNELDKFEYSSVERGIRALGDIAWWSEERIRDLQQAMGEGARGSLVAEEWPQLRHDDPALLDEQMGQREQKKSLQPHEPLLSMIVTPPSPSEAAARGGPVPWSLVSGSRVRVRWHSCICGLLQHLHVVQYTGVRKSAHKKVETQTLACTDIILLQ